MTSAQAFHWFDHDKRLPEIARVLRPGGRIALVWNSRDDSDPWMARLAAIIGNEIDPGVGRDAGARRKAASSAGRDGAVRLEQTLDRDGLLDLVLSRSYCAKLQPLEREPVLDAVARVVRRDRGPEGVRSRT